MSADCCQCRGVPGFPAQPCGHGLAHGAQCSTPAYVCLMMLAPTGTTAM